MICINVWPENTRTKYKWGTLRAYHNRERESSDMSRFSGMEHLDVRKGAWTKEEDILLRKCIEKYGEGKWRQAPMRAGIANYYFAHFNYLSAMESS